MATVSVIMGIYNCGKTLPDAVNSILNQSFTDWQLIMCDDASTDDTYTIAMEYQNKYPEKIKVLKNEHNLGLNATLNRCLQIANGAYIARMDGDDICSEHRFEKELFVLKNEPDISIVSSAMTYFDESGVWGESNLPLYPQTTDFLGGTPFCHAASMVRKEAFDSVGGYSVDKKLIRVEDYHLWLKMYKAGYRGKNIPEALYSMRDDRNAYSRRKFRYRINEAYVKYLVVKELKLPKYNYIHALKPVIVGLIPNFIYNKLHKGRLKKSSE